MDFNEVNVDNRLRHLVRGRVIVFTNSKTVEYLEHGLDRSFPLYSFAPFQRGYGAAFLVELDGYLTFDIGSYVKISEPLSAFNSVYFDPNGAKVVFTADPARPYIILAYSVNFVAQVQVQVDANTTETYSFVSASPEPTDDEIRRVFATDAYFRGFDKYPGWTFSN